MDEATDRERCRLQGTTRSACRLPRRHDAPVAQRIEHLTTDQEVGGSSPSGRATHRPRFTDLNYLSWNFKLISVNHSVIQLSSDHVPKARPQAPPTRTYPAARWLLSSAGVRRHRSGHGQA